MRILVHLSLDDGALAAQHIVNVVDEDGRVVALFALVKDVKLPAVQVDETVSELSKQNSKGWH